MRFGAGPVGLTRATLPCRQSDVKSGSKSSSGKGVESTTPHPAATGRGAAGLYAGRPCRWPYILPIAVYAEFLVGFLGFLGSWVGVCREVEPKIVRLGCHLGFPLVPFLSWRLVPGGSGSAPRVGWGTINVYTKRKSQLRPSAWKDSPHGPPHPPMAPQPPANRVTPLAFGQPYTGPNGEQLIAQHDGVLTEFLVGGEPAASLFQSVESAMAFATTIATAAGKASTFAVKEDGTQPSALERILRLGGTK